MAWLSDRLTCRSGWKLDSEKGAMHATPTQAAMVLNIANQLRFIFPYPT